MGSKLWEEGKLYYMIFQNTFNFPCRVTVKMLLNHRSGLPNYVLPDNYKWDKRHVTGAYCNHCILTNPAIQCWKKIRYCNTNFALLALIIEKVGGVPYAKFMDSVFFKPLQMNDTSILIGRFC
jgi:CubicO group peptidase (beta-lactamase class C family)